MNPLGVLCARDVLEPCEGAPDVLVEPDTDIREVMEKVGETGSPVGVVDNGVVIGQVTKDRVLKKLLDPRS